MVAQAVRPGEDGAPGVGVPAGGDEGDVLAKATGADFDTEWVEPTGGGASTLVGLTDVTGTPDTGKAPVSDGAGTFPLTDVATQAELNAETGARGAADTAEAAARAAADTAEAVARAAADTAAIATAETYSDAALATHAGAADPHTGYQKESEKGSSNGYAGLDGAGVVPDAQLPAALARDTEVTNAVAAEASARDSAISAAIAALVASAPGLLDTLDEIAAALGDDPNFAATITSALAGKQPLDSDLTAIAALTTTAFGRAVLALADQAALLAAAGAAAASHVHSGADITSGTVVDARIDAAIARDSEVAGLAALVKLDDFATPDDNTDLNASTSKHGLLRKLSGTSSEYLDGSGAFSTPPSAGAPTTATYITQTADAGLSAEQALSALATGLLKNTTGTGVLSAAAEGTDFWKPGGTDVAVADGGTGASTAAGARTNLGVWTPNVVIADQTADFTSTGTVSTMTQLGNIAPSITIASGSRVRVTLAGYFECATTAQLILRLNIDSGASTLSIGRCTIFSAGSPIATSAILTGLSAGAHTVKVEFTRAISTTLNLRASSQPTLEHFSIILEELPA